MIQELEKISPSGLREETLLYRMMTKQVLSVLNSHPDIQHYREAFGGFLIYKKMNKVLCEHVISFSVLSQ